MTNIGIDIPISELDGVFTSSLWTDKDVAFYGRIYRNERTEEGSQVIIPETFDYTNEEYVEVLLDDSHDGHCFFDVLPDNEFDGLYIANVRILFAVNLLELYPSAGVRATEYAHRDVKNYIDLSQFTIERLVRGATAFNDYGYISQNRQDMHPFYLFRYDTRLEYEININCYE